MKFRQSILNLLLVALSLFVVHDLVMVEIDTNTQVQFCLTDAHDHHDLDTLSTLHDRMHHILDAVGFLELPHVSTFTVKGTFEYRCHDITHLSITLERPPTLFIS